ncbi:MAG TPA: hypothetical protein VJV96_10995, partial [Candidatus Angelobacter sp.]|nr:hypothetical protein [Candidatus Angelobacter sp.]
MSESFFTLFSALNSCGYDAGLAESLPVRQAITSDLLAITQKSQTASSSRDAICQFWTEHKGANGEMDVSQYVSLALELSNPPAFTTEIPEGDMPPDAAY